MTQPCTSAWPQPPAFPPGYAILLFHPHNTLHLFPLWQLCSLSHPGPVVTLMKCMSPSIGFCIYLCKSMAVPSRPGERSPAVMSSDADIPIWGEDWSHTVRYCPATPSWAPAQQMLVRWFNQWVVHRGSHHLQVTHTTRRCSFLPNPQTLSDAKDFYLDKPSRAVFYKIIFQSNFS